tara:strand:- start:1829 stop:2809 length:981 start_codon:yes stop_codon:yes gene_type:complete
VIHRIAITPGDPAGIGPDICALISRDPPENTELVVFADRTILEARAQKLGISISLKPYVREEAPTPSAIGELSLVQINKKADVTIGKLNAVNSPYVLESLELATQKVLDQELDAVVTGPVHKGIINDAGIDFSGHTEYLAGLCKVKRSVMMLATDDLRVALATTHIPLSEVPNAITKSLLRDVIRILHGDLQKRFYITKPTILISGLNPHAGESGHLGREEIEVIQPVLTEFQKQGMNLIGPLPADTLFSSSSLDKADAVLSMYHDQGLPVLKFKGFGKATNITLGLPIIRTSVDHGTALDKAGTGEVDIGSLYQAIAAAKAMIKK